MPLKSAETTRFEAFTSYTGNRTVRALQNEINLLAVSGTKRENKTLPDNLRALYFIFFSSDI